MSKTIEIYDEFVLTPEQVAKILLPRQGGLVTEVNVDQMQGHFEMQEGIASQYQRSVFLGDELPDGSRRVSQRLLYSVHLLGFGALIAVAIKSRLRSISADYEMPIWLPPDLLDIEVARELVRLLLISVSTAYFATLLGQTLTFSAKEFHASVRAQAAVLLLSRLDIAFGFLLLLFVTRKGRVFVVRTATILGTIFTLLSALAPNMTVLAVLQVLAKGATAAIGVLVTVSVAEAVSRRQRAWAIGLMVVGAALGAGFCDLLLPIAGISIWSWRILYLVSLPLGVCGAILSLGIHETKRFEEFRAGVGLLPVRASLGQISRSRLALLAAAAFLTNAFLIPTTQFRNEYLRTERHFSAAQIGIFVILTNIPGVLGLVIGGRFAETKGRKVVGSVAIIVGGGGLALGFISIGVGLWVWTIIGSAIVTAIVPSLGVYQTELFSTQSRSLGGGYVTAASRIGSVVGVAFVGYFSAFLSLGDSVALLFICMVLLFPLFFLFFPETKDLILEEIV